MPNPIERDAAGSAPSATEAPGLIGVFHTLAMQHAEAGALLTRLRQTRDAADRAPLWTKLRRELLSHEKGELLSVYPELRANPETRDIAEEHDREAGQLEAAVDELEALGPAARSWDAKLAALASMVQRHVDEEEGEFFPAAIAALGRNKCEALNRTFLAQKEAVAGRLG